MSETTQAEGEHLQLEPSSSTENLLHPRKRKKTTNFSICKICGQDPSAPGTKVSQALPAAFLEEEAALTDDRLLLYGEENISDLYSKPLHKVTKFSVFDVEGHLCPFDTGLIESDQLLYFNGYIKPIYDDDPNPLNGVPTQEMGPIVEWWISGFDGGDSFLIGFVTPYAEYILMEPSPEYEPFMRIPKQKALLTKIVIEFLSNSFKPTLDDLLNRINEVSVPPDIEAIDEDTLGKYAQFLIEQVREVDDRNKLMSTPAVVEIISKYHVDVSCIKKKGRFHKISKPVTTPLVREIFKFFLEEEKYFDNLKDEEAPDAPQSEGPKKIIWEPNSNFAIVNNEKISVGDFVYIDTPERSKLYRVEYFFQQNFTKKVHCSEIGKGSSTILGHACKPNEYFFLNLCSDWALSKIICQAKVTIRQLPNTWDAFLKYQSKALNEGNYVEKKYLIHQGTFEDYTENKGGECLGCSYTKNIGKFNQIRTFGEKRKEEDIIPVDRVVWKKMEFFPGCCVFLEPVSIVFDAEKTSRRIEKKTITLKADETLYPEFYRKIKELISKEECPEPFAVARIKQIFYRYECFRKVLYITVNKFYRAENTRVADIQKDQDPRLLYWSEEKADVPFDYVVGRCDVIYSKTPPEFTLHKLFYYNSAFDSETEMFYEINPKKIVRTDKKPSLKKPLKTLNVFSGCGGLAEGLRQSGVADITWAVEIDKSTANAYKLNFPSVQMFEKDCNAFLQDVMSNNLKDKDGNRYPMKGEVEFLCGGPPCQGFSFMNRYTSKEESRYNNSLILTFLSLCDFYRPKYILMENVKNFTTYKKSIFLKHTIKCLVAMGYQCTFDVLQAGNFGLPQNRKRLFILAAAPGLVLPKIPKPTHVFCEPVKSYTYETSNEVNRGKNFSSSAAYRMIRIRDAIWGHDKKGTTHSGLSKKALPQRGFYDRFLMGTPCELRDLESKELSPLNNARVRHIPTSENSDWRDLPNIAIRLRNGSKTNILKYTHHDQKNGKSSNGSLRGVCSCAAGLSCQARFRQNNTLIPWCMVHTANRNNNWSGVFGRLNWNGIFNTVTTNPEPSSQQGKVLHPDEDRTVNVRECARAQGLPDSFHFFGTACEKFKQVGNAVPPPMARAIGWEIIKSICLTTPSDASEEVSIEDPSVSEIADTS